jgi:hypothetical protein
MSGGFLAVKQSHEMSSFSLPPVIAKRNKKRQIPALWQSQDIST